MLDLYLRWERGELVLIDPAMGRRIATSEDERARADREREARIEEMEARAAAEAERNVEREARIQEREARAQAETRADAERGRADSAEARIRELESENQRLRGG